MFWLGAGSNFTTGSLATSWASTGNNRAVGQVNSADSTSNNFFITGVQWEVGTFDSNSIPPFQFEDRATSLARCQRYYNDISSILLWGNVISTSYTFRRCSMAYPVEMRAAPTVTVTSTQSFSAQSISTKWVGFGTNGSSSTSNVYVSAATFEAEL